jgi:predicted phosphodiesterase
MARRIAISTDFHGCLYALEEFLRIAEAEKVDEAWHCGDLPDRGPDSIGVIQLCRKLGIKGILGNHDSAIWELWKEYKKTGRLPKNTDKASTIAKLTDADGAYLGALPHFHVMDDIGLILVHGGLWPNLPLYKQPTAVKNAQLINPNNPGESKWWGGGCVQRYGYSEDHFKAQGFARWYEVLDADHDVVFGHSVFLEPLVHQGLGRGRAIGIDQGGVFGNYFTVLIYPDMKFIKIPAKKAYAQMTHSP